MTHVFYWRFDFPILHQEYPISRYCKDLSPFIMDQGLQSAVNITKVTEKIIDLYYTVHNIIKQKNLQYYGIFCLNARIDEKLHLQLG